MKMKLKTKRITSLILIMTIIMAVLVGCAGTPTTITTTGTTAPTTTPTTTAPLPEPGNPQLPLTDTPVTLRGFYPMTAQGLSVIANWGENEGQKELARRTGITIQWQNPVIGQHVEAFNLMINAGDLPDIIIDDFNAYPGGRVAALADGLILEVTELVNQYAPNYRVLREQDEQFAKESITDEGKMAGFHGYAVASDVRPWGGFMIRNDWLNDLSLPVPETYDDWYTTLKAFRDQKGADVPFILNKTGDFLGNALSGGFMTGLTVPFFHIDGVVKYGPIESGFEEYLTMLNKWYNEGLISEDFMTDQNPVFAPDASKIVTGRSGLFYAAVPLVNMYKTMGTPADPDFDLIAVPCPVKTRGQVPPFNSLGGGSGKSSGFVAISARTADPALVARWIDYQYSPDGYLLSNFGIEGVSYQIVDGKPRFLESFLADPDGITKYIYRYGSTIYDMDVEFEQLTPEPLKAFYNVWSEAGYAHYLPGGTPIGDEGERQASIMADINTYVQESTIKFIIGTRPLTEFDSFVSTVKSMGIDEVIAINQAQYDRFLARG